MACCRKSFALEPDIAQTCEHMNVTMPMQINAVRENIIAFARIANQRGGNVPVNRHNARMLAFAILHNPTVCPLTVPPQSREVTHPHPGAKGEQQGQSNVSRCVSQNCNQGRALIIVKPSRNLGSVARESHRLDHVDCHPPAPFTVRQQGANGAEVVGHGFWVQGFGYLIAVLCHHLWRYGRNLDGAPKVGKGFPAGVFVVRQGGGAACGFCFAQPVLNGLPQGDALRPYTPRFHHALVLFRVSLGSERLGALCAVCVLPPDKVGFWSVGTMFDVSHEQEIPRGAGYAKNAKPDQEPDQAFCKCLLPQCLPYRHRNLPTLSPSEIARKTLRFPRVLRVIAHERSGTYTNEPDQNRTSPKNSLRFLLHGQAGWATL